MAEDVVGTFGTIDYVVFGCMLGISVLIGVYHAFAGGTQKSTKEFLLASGSMHPVPVAMSLVASFISAITVLGTPAEMYVYGSMFWLYAISYIFAGFFGARFVIPVIFRIDLTSANQYLEMRFNKTVRICGLVAFMIQMFIYMGIVIYAPALALNQVTGINLWGSVLATGLACTIYTSIGGMKAVLWTDVFQMLVMLSGFLAVIIEGCRRIGGINKMWQICEDNGRIDFWNFDPDPTIRHTFWTIVIGGAFNWGYTYGVNQAQVQRYLSCGTPKRAQVSLFLAIIGMIVVVSLACLSGLTMYAYYSECDPFTLGRVGATDQLIAYFTLELFGKFPGLPGLFTSAVFSGALSSVSSGLNALAAVTTEDFIKAIWKDIPDTRLSWISKGGAFSYGILSILMAYVVSLMSGSILQISLSLFGMIGGPLLGLFSLGMFFPWSNSKGAVVGFLIGLAITWWIGIGAIFNPVAAFKLPLTTEGCDLDHTTVAMVTSIMTGLTAEESESAINKVYTLSYAYYPVVGWCVTIVIGLLFSFLTGATKARDVDPKLFISVADAMYCCFPESCKRLFRCGIPRYEDINDETKSDYAEALKMTEYGIDAYEEPSDEKAAEGENHIYENIMSDEEMNGGKS